MNLCGFYGENGKRKRGTWGLRRSDWSRPELALTLERAMLRKLGVEEISRGN